MTKDLISVIVPCFNVSKFLDDCFCSLENQTFKNFEVIFVNDGSTDNTLERLQNFCNNHSNCKVVNQENQGVSAARNNGLAVASGEFIYFYDPDDMLAPNILEILHRQIQGFDISICGVKKIDENFPYKKVASKKLKKSKTFSETEELLCELFCAKTFYVTLWDKLYRHSIIKQMENYPNVLNSHIHYGEDLDFNFMYMTCCKNAIFTPSKMYLYRKRKGSAIHSTFNAEKMMSIFAAHNKNAAICAEKFPNVEKYINAFACISCVEMLFRIYASDYNNREIITQLFKDLKANKKFLRKAKKMPRYLRWTIPVFVPPILKMLLRKHLK